MGGHEWRVGGGQRAECWSNNCHHPPKSSRGRKLRLFCFISRFRCSFWGLQQAAGPGRTGICRSAS